MSEFSDSPSIIFRWHELSREADALLRQNEELMECRVALCRRRSELFRDLMQMTRGFVDDVSISIATLKKTR